MYSPPAYTPLLAISRLATKLTRILWQVLEKLARMLWQVKGSVSKIATSFK